MFRLRYKTDVLYYILRGYDFLVIILAFLITYLLDSRTSYIENYVVFEDYAYKNLWIYIFTSFTVISYIDKEGGYNLFRDITSYEMVPIITKAMIINFMLLVSIIFLINLKVDKLQLIYFSMATYILLMVSRVVLRVGLRALYRQGYYSRNILLVGTGKRALTYAEKLTAHHDWGVRIVGYVDNQPTPLAQEILGDDIIGEIDDIPSLIENNVIDEVIIILPRSWISRLERTIHLCEELGTEVTIVADFFNMHTARASVSHFQETPLLTYTTAPQKNLQILVKNIIDFILSVLLLILFLPLFLFSAVVIKLTSPGPIFFTQTRCGLNGRVFTMYKFRTMYEDAEKKINYLKQYNEMSGPVFKMKNDPRITPIGRFLRRTSLDELPQLINVLKGEMSLVGPRPPIPNEVEKYDRWQRRRLSVRPGLSCIWQISGRNNVDFQEWMELDLYYIDHWSLWLDLKILVMTLPAVVKGEGAT